MDTTAIIVFVTVWTFVTIVVIVACKLFAKYCYKKRGGVDNPLEQNSNSATVNNVTIIITGAEAGTTAIPLQDLAARHRSRCFTAPAASDPRQGLQQARQTARAAARAAKELPPNYNLAVSHPSIYKKRASVPVLTRQETQPPPPHYDDLDNRFADLEHAMSTPNLTSVHQDLRPERSRPTIALSSPSIT